MDPKTEMDEHITELIQRIQAARRTLRHLETELAVEQSKCKHKYIRTRDDDYHHTRWVYTCEKCGYFTHLPSE